MKHWICRISAMLVVAALSGCASSFNTGWLDPVEEYPAVAMKKTVYVDLAYSGKLDGTAWPRNDIQNQAFLKQRCLEHLTESGLFSFASGDLDTTDLRLYVAIINDKQTDLKKQTLCALTLFLVPYTATDSFRLMAVLKDARTGEETKLTLKDGVKHRQSLFLAPLAPFNSSDDALEACTDRLLQNLCQEIHRSGFVN
ncbi:hypothetical protein [Pontiella sp.]|uniref:hypothetical protein n=1 Tax=Pontiella sp. TaxID=2837462 RepID=UPI003564E1DE